MLFNSIAFLIFLPVVFALYWAVPKKAGWQNAIVVGASLFFYGWWDWRFLVLICASVLWTYLFALRGWKVSVGVAGLVAVLGFFKYYNFFVESLPLATDKWHLDLVLPLGISFYTFMCIGYLLDVHWQKIQPEKNFLRCSTFLMFFPQIAAGPIGRAHQLLPQFSVARRFDSNQAIHGLTLISAGLFKKIVVADTLALYVNKVWLTPELYSSASLVIAAVFYSIEIYCDFSGYSDIARGVAKQFNIELMLNFDRPYLSRSFGEFWKRWHISLSSWFKDYLYIPLGGNRKGLARTIINLWIVMLVSGLWHGAAWGFVLWGALYAVYMTLGRFTKAYAERLPGIVHVVLLNVGVAFAWIFFRGGTLTASCAFLKRLFTAGFKSTLMQICGGQGPVYMGLSLFLVGALFVSAATPRDCRFSSMRGHLLFSSLYLVLIVFFGITSESAFIYFQF